MKINLISICFIFAAVRSVLSVELRDICVEDTFKYGDYEIDSVHMVKNHVNLKSIAWFAIDEDEKFENFGDKTYEYKMLEIKKEYNHILTTLYSERFLNQNLSSKSFDEMRNKTKLIYTKLQNLYDQNNVKGEFQKISSIRDLIPRTIDLINFLSSFYDSKLPPTSNKTNQLFLNDEFDCDLKSILQNLTVNDNQTFAFADEFVADIHDKPIISRPKFYLSKYSKLFLDFRSTGKLEFEIVLPFNNLNYYQNLTNIPNCLKAKDLPKFYQYKAYEF